MQSPQQGEYFVYILGSQPQTDVQIGLASDLQQQIRNIGHHHPVAQTDAPNLHLVYYEHYKAEEAALNRIRQLKSNSLDATYNLIASMNPHWLDLSDTLNS
ncbi:excinuclease ABC subunit C [Pontibacter sp. 172403-2]|nr:excinuclease ABC subunit C [Pontibacter sp. 172403-2]